MSFEAAGGSRSGGAFSAVADRLLVRFEGTESGVDALSWGQQEMWGSMVRKHTWMPIGAVAPVPAGTTVRDVAADLRFLMRHYPTLRTRIDPDRPAQVVAGSGEVPLELVDAEDDPAGMAEQVRLRYWNTSYDAAHQWPIRMAVVRHRGVPTHRVWVMCHLVTDGAGARIMLEELRRRDPTGSAGAMSALAQRTGADTGPVLLALFALALARVTGISPVVTRVTVNNRFRPRLDELLARVSQERGEEVDLGCFFNHRKPETGAVAARHLGFRWAERRYDTPYDRLFVTVDELPDTMSVLVYIDTRYVSPADAERCVRGMAELAVEVAPDRQGVAI